LPFFPCPIYFITSRRSIWSVSDLFMDMSISHHALKGNILLDFYWLSFNQHYNEFYIAQGIFLCER